MFSVVLLTHLEECCIVGMMHMWLEGGRDKSVTGDESSRRVNRTLIRARAGRKGLREQVHFSLFSEDYGGDSPRIKAEKLPDRP
jgi:hypothetical protein